MTTFYDVPTNALLDALAERLDGELDAPEWVAFAKSGAGREMPPEQDDFWARRGASLLRKIAIDGPVGVSRLRTEYGSSKQGSTRYRVRPPNQHKGSGNVIRTLVQQLEAAGYVEAAGGEGRRVTGDGRALLDEVATDVFEELDRPELERYA